MQITYLPEREQPGLGTDPNDEVMDELLGDESFLRRWVEYSSQASTALLRV